MPVGFRCNRQVNGHDVALREYFFDAALFISRVVLLHIRVVKPDIAGIIAHHARYQLANGAEAHHTDGFARQLSAFEMQVRIMRPFLPVAAFQPIDAGNGIAQQHDYGGDEHFSYRLRIARGREKYGDAQCRCFRYRYVRRCAAAYADELQLRECRDHIGRNMVVLRNKRFRGGFFEQRNKLAFVISPAMGLPRAVNDLSEQLFNFPDPFLVVGSCDQNSHAKWFVIFLRIDGYGAKFLHCLAG